MSIKRLKAKCVAHLAATILFVCSGAGVAQTPRVAPSPDSLVDMLESPDWHVRDRAVFALNLLSANRLPDNYPATVISLLEREAISPSPHSDGEGHGEYLINVMRGVVRLRDQRSLRGLALLGIQMSRESKEFVASQGAASIPFLDEAWSRDSMNHDAVAVTWAYMLGKYGQGLSRQDRVQVISRLAGVLQGNTRAFTWAAMTNVHQQSCWHVSRNGLTRFASGLRGREAASARPWGRA